MGPGAPPNAHLFEVAEARDGHGLGLGLGQRGQEQRRENGDDGNHDQQFNEREGLP
jgi:hypothetical protein